MPPPRLPRPRRLLAVVASLLVITAGSAGVASPRAGASDPVTASAGAEPSAPPEAPSAGTTSQGDKLVVLREIARRLTQDRPEDQRHLIPGYAGVALHPDRGQVVLYWKGPLPAWVDEVLASPPSGVGVEVRHSEADVLRGLRRLVSTSGKPAEEFGRAGAHFTFSSGDKDGVGLRIHYADARPLEADGDPSSARARQTAHLQSP